MKRILLTVLMCVLHTALFARGIGSWRAFPAYRIATQNIPVGNRVYSLCNGNLLSYNTSDEEVVCYDKISPLSDSRIEHMAYSKEARRLLLVYDNGNMDLLDGNDGVVNLAQYKNLSSTDKGINSVTVDGTMAYVCTNSGVMTVDMAEGVFVCTYDLGRKVLCCATDGTHLYANTPGGTLRGALAQNLQDRANWVEVGTQAFTNLFFLNGTFYVYIDWNGLFRADADMNLTRINTDRYTFRSLENGRLIVGNASKVVVFDGQASPQTFTGANAFRCLTYGNGLFWGSCGWNGLQAYKADASSSSLIPYGEAICPNSPAYDYFYYMKYVGARLLVAGGCLNYNGVDYEGSALYYENDSWTNFEPGDSITRKTGLPYVNLTTIAQDPFNANHHFVSSGRQGLYEFEKGRFVKLHTYTNSSLASILPNSSNAKNYVNCSGLTYDAQGNLWMLNSQVDTIVKVLKPNGEWVRLYYSEIEGAPTCDFLHFDRSGRLWATSRRVTNRGIFCLDYNGTLENRSDDRHLLRNTLVNQDGISYTPDEFYCLTEDRDGQLWVGTNLGPFVITWPSAFFNSDFYVEQIKIARDDGSGLADYLLNGIVVNVIAVDGANRKWIGTTGNGAYLISADGQEMLLHFTADNSPLLSDNVLSIAVNGTSGEVMFGTDKGLVSYMGDATEGAEELDDDNIYAYPNPVPPTYNGRVVVKGLTRDCEVKVTSTTGQLIYAGTSNGGVFTWNGCNAQGRRVASGVYNVLTNTADGKDCVVTKIVFIR